MKKTLKAILALRLLAGMLAGCSSGPSATGTVKQFLSAFQSDQMKKAASYVTKSDQYNPFDSKSNKNLDGMSAKEGKKFLKAMTKKYKFEKPQLVSKDKSSAKVKVKITSVNFGAVMMKVIGQAMPLALANAFSNNKDKKSQKSLDKMMEANMISDLTSDSAPMSTRTVTLTLKKDTDGHYKIVANKNLMNAILANYSSLNDLFGGKKSKK